MNKDPSPISKLGGNAAFIAAKALAEAQVEGALSIWRAEMLVKFAEAVRDGDTRAYGEALIAMEKPPAGFRLATGAELDQVPFGLICQFRNKPALGWVRSQFKPWKTVPHGDRKSYRFAVPVDIAVPEPWAGLLKMTTGARA